MVGFLWRVFLERVGVAWLRPLAVSLVLGLALVVGFRSVLRSAEARVGPPFTTTKVIRGAMQARVRAVGAVRPVKSVRVDTQISGRVVELNVDFNSRVKKGDVLARIDPRLFQVALEQARANLLVARTNLGRARLRLETVEWEGEDGARHPAEITEVAATRALEAQAAAAVARADLNLALATVVSPIDGVVVSRNIEAGQMVNAALPSPTLFAIAEDLSQMQIEASVAEADVSRLARGMTARFTVDAWPNQAFEGVIREIRDAPRLIDQTVTYDAMIDVDNGKLAFKPGMTARVMVVYAARTAVMKVPNTALRYEPSAAVLERIRPFAAPGAGERTVWVLRKGEPAPMTVQVGVSDGAFTEVVDGPLMLNDVVITEEAGARSGTGILGRIF